MGFIPRQVTCLFSHESFEKRFERIKSHAFNNLKTIHWLKLKSYKKYMKTINVHHVQTKSNQDSSQIKINLN